MRILVVGTATQDLVSQVDHYPPEDAEVRARARERRLGGNAANTALVLTQLGHRVEWAGSLAGDEAGDWIARELTRAGIGLDHARRHAGGQSPLSCVTLSRDSGSRTIVHYRDLPEFDAADFAAIPLDGFDWIHFEGRNVPALEAMLARVPSAIPCSLEVEKPRPGIEGLLGRPGLLLFSRAYARARGFDAAAGLLAALTLGPGQMAVCAWGEAGAWALDAAGRMVHSPAFVPARVVDTLGAGDVFNAAVIDRLAHGAGVDEALRQGCRLAGRKCGRPGLSGLAGEEERDG